MNEVLAAFDRRRSNVLAHGLAERAAGYIVSFPISAMIAIYGVRSVDIPSLYSHAAHIWQLRNGNDDEINADLHAFVFLGLAASIASIVYEAIEFHHVAVVCPALLCSQHVIHHRHHVVRYLSRRSSWA